jgi:hypothetical protein
MSDPQRLEDVLVKIRALELPLRREAVQTEALSEVAGRGFPLIIT